MAPIAVAICWIVLIAAMNIFMMVFSILKQDIYLTHLQDGWPITLDATALGVITVLFAALVLTLSKKAGIKWLTIVARVHLFVYLGMSFLFGLVTLAYLLS